MKSLDFLKEGFVDDAQDVHLDHEVQMAREECYHAAEHALAIHKLLRNISEQQGLEGWVSSKITLANDYLNTVREHLEYELLSDREQSLDQIAIGMPVAEGTLNELSPGFGGAGRWYTDYEIADIVGEDWLSDDLFSSGANMTRYGDAGKEQLKQEAQEHLENEGYSVEVLDVKANEDHLSWFISGPMMRLGEQGVAEAQSMTTALGNALSKVEPGSKLDKKIRHHNDMVRRFGPEAGTMTSAPDGYHIDKKGFIRLGQGVAEGSKWRKHPDAYDVDDEGNKTPRNPNSPKFGYDPLQRRADTAGDAKTPKGKAAALKTSLKMAKGQQGVAEGSTKQAKARKEAEAVMAAIKRLEAELKDPNPHSNKADIQRRLDNEKRRLELYRDVLDEHGVAEGKKCNHTMEGTKCPVHGLAECPTSKAKALAEWKKEQRRLKETSAGSVAGVVNLGGKPKNKVGSLFGGTYKQPQKKKD